MQNDSTSIHTDLALDPRLIDYLHSDGFDIRHPLLTQSFPIIHSGIDVLSFIPVGILQIISYMIPIIDLLIKMERPPRSKEDEVARPFALIIYPKEYPVQL